MDRTAFERFAVKYWGQNVRKTNLYFHSTEVDCESLKDIVYLQLRSIDSLTDEELITCSSIDSLTDEELIICSKHHGWVKMLLTTENIIHLCKCNDLKIKVVDYLRSIGILVPADGYTVEQLISNGWVKI